MPVIERLLFAVVAVLLFAACVAATMHPRWPGLAQDGRVSALEGPAVRPWQRLW